MEAATKQGRSNRQLMKKLAVVALLMFVFAWGLIPLYKVVCEVTGLNDVVKADSLDDTATNGGAAAHEVDMTFDATVQAGLPWQVRPLQTRLKVKPGQFVQVEYEITNASGQRVVGQAIPRYLPAAAGEYVKKLECFCFRQQAFAPGETRRFPVVFVVDKRLPASIDSITLAYTVFDVPGNAGAGS